MKKILTVLAIASLSLAAIAGCANKNSIKPGDAVSITYIATFSDGTIFDQNTPQNPLIFIIGSGQTIAGLDKGVVGMKIGKTKTITITPEEGYGALYNKNNVQKVSKFIFDKLSITPENGSTQKLGDIEGVVKGTEQDESGNTLVLFDINPRQTRDTLKYKVTVIAKASK